MIVLCPTALVPIHLPPLGVQLLILHGEPESVASICSTDSATDSESAQTYVSYTYVVTKTRLLCRTTQGCTISDSVLCFYCATKPNASNGVYRQHVLHKTITGFSNWQKAISKFNKYAQLQAIAMWLIWQLWLQNHRWMLTKNCPLLCLRRGLKIEMFGMPFFPHLTRQRKVPKR